MNARLWIWLGILLICTAQTVTAELEKSAKPQLLVESAQLQEQMRDSNLRIIDVRSSNEYSQGHIPGAVHVDVGEWKTLATADGGLHDAKRWAKKVGSLGITENTHVVVYGDRLSNTARIWWLLKYLGVSNASILNGGWQWWTKKDRPIETSTPQVRVTEFKPKLQADRLAEIDSVKKTIKAEKVKVVDTRSDSEFAGGRIPESVHLEWTHLVAEDGRFKTKSQLQELFRKHGILQSETAVCY